MEISSKILFALLLPASWLGAQRAVDVNLQAPPVGTYTVENMADINTEYLDYCAVPYGSGVMFTSARGGKRVFVCDQDLVTGRFSDLYFAKEDAEGRFFSPDMVSGDINGKYHDGAPTFTPDGQTMIFSRNNRDGQSQKGLIDLKIYAAKLNRGSWEDVKELTFNDDDFSNCHPTLSADGNLLYFSSNRPGGYGGMDIYLSKKAGEDWGLPINLGPNVNSVGDEIFPFLTASNTLYFSSNGWKGMGGLDVYAVLMGGVEASQLLPLPAPINSVYDDFAFTSDKRELKGYLTSNRPGGKGQDDIYRWNFNGVRPQLANVCVVDKVTGTRIADANLKIRPAEETTWSALEQAPKTEQEYVVLYAEKITDKAPAFTSCEVKVPVVPGENYYVEVNKAGYMPMRLLATATEMLAQPEYLVPIETSRAIAFTGVVRNRATDIPIPGSTVKVLNKCTNDVQDYQTSANGSFTFPLDCQCDYVVLAQKPGFAKHAKLWKTGEVNCAEGTATIAMYLAPETDMLETPTTELEVGTVIKLENIHYTFNKSNIRRDAAVELDRVVELMKKYPTLEIELGSHTDARGSDSYNERLSQQRANAAVKYIVSKGISRGRLTAKGYGESQLLNECENGVECDDATHEQNRRTDIKITRLEEKGVRY
ncbi:MAG: OmpA family protein [Saprospiraceae bacterium]|nr:OmpA family protein [Saprospiraceae bacterium]MCF8248642.1 OmpA family protein [Saprospiraceae bacterium]MCF8278868.1 OmpA family protein [Bacteroidales bacterium]MCF8310668.1 OmpA family protein [Saprospiraceae bacterium]MCF8439227.1 OmpA family protein [Saprospiraceae bacterium]